MKRLAITTILILLILLFLYAAHLDGIIHIKAFAAQDCEFCEFLNDHDLQADLEAFPQVEIGSIKSIDYELVLNDKLVFGHDRAARRTIYYNIPMNYCPECGRIIR